uniref:Kynureninase n=1 Tax=uncultured bacterium 1116 TaxID=548899 RepID=B8R8Z9_9BACT|nr:putative kynureninase [uncultured bacterium 1116]
MTLITRADCQTRDRADPLAPFRDRFVLPQNLVYLDGNSLGALPKAAAARIKRSVEAEWGQDLIKSWNLHRWIDLPQRAGAKIARLVGAKAGEVIVADSTSVNLFKLLAAALAMRPGRRVILSEPGNFPTDLYVAQGLIEMLGGKHELKLVPAEKIIGAIDDKVAVVSLTHVNYKSGRIHDMAAVTAKAHAAGALMLWDLCHSAGALPVDLNAAKADLAVGCGYKYLNGGPGAPAFLFVAGRHQEAIRPPLSGWMGHAHPFTFDVDYEPAEGIARNLCGSPPVLSMSALDAALDVMLEADMAAIRMKSLALGDLFLALIEQECGTHGFVNGSAPRSERGSQVGLLHPEGYAIMQALIAKGVIGDFRAPDMLRFGFAPLYNRYLDVWEAVAGLKTVMDARTWDAPKFRTRAAVT